MRKLGEFCIVLIVAVVALSFCGSTASAVHRMDDWVGQNTNPNNQFANGQSTFAPDNNYGIISATSVGGQVQSKVNFTTADDPPEPIIPTLDTPFIFLADQQLDTTGAGIDGIWGYDDEFHMTGTITFNSPQANEPNFCFCWYNSSNTAHRIGLGISNRTVNQGGAIENRLRMDFGYGATATPTPGNRFYFASDTGTRLNTEVESTLANGSYPFSFDYVPGTVVGTGTLSLTVGPYSKTTAFENTPWESDFFEMDRFGIVQRATGNQTQLGFYNVTFSNVTYTGGTDAPMISGDHNGDGNIDGADYVAWRKDPANFGGDPGGYNAWVAQFGSAPGSGGGAVPEPGSLILILCGCAALVFGERYSRRR